MENGRSKSVDPGTFKTNLTTYVPYKPAQIPTLPTNAQITKPQETTYVGSRISQLLAGPGLTQTNSSYKPMTESSTKNLHVTQTIAY